MARRAPVSDATDVIVVGSGPNGLTAGAVLARAGLAVTVIEAAGAPGGGCRSAELTLPGFVHDVCSAVHPLGALSPAFRALELEKFGLAWVRPRVPLAHPLPDGSVAVLRRSIAETAQGLGGDAPAWERLLGAFSREDFLQSLLLPWWEAARADWRAHARFGRHALRSAESLARSQFDAEPARALFAGCAAHSVMALDRAGTSAFGLVLAAAGHALDWPCARGGSQAITQALVGVLAAHGGRLELGRRVTDVRELPPARAVLFDLSPHQVAEIASAELPAGYRERLRRFRHGPGVFKVDWALREPIPWRNAECREAMTVHVGGSFAEVLAAESAMMHGSGSERPFVLVAQQSLFDASRAPAGRHTGWAYCHVPPGGVVDMTARIEAQIERFAPGFRDCILARHSISPAQLAARNAAMIGGDMAGGRNDLAQVLFRPCARPDPYATPNPRLFLCSASTPPGGGAHGMCGFHAATRVLRHLRRAG